MKLIVTTDTKTPLTDTVCREILEAWFATVFDEEGLNQAHKLDELGA